VSRRCRYRADRSTDVAILGGVESSDGGPAIRVKAYSLLGGLEIRDR
jgi:hypothetical protein